MKSVMQLAVAAALGFATSSALADGWEVGPNGSDNGSGSVNVLLPYAPPQVHDLANVGGVADQDWFRVSLETNRSYDVSIGNSNIDWLSGQILERWDNAGTTKLQDAETSDRGGYRRTLRWVHTGAAGEQKIKATGTNSDTSNAFYEIALRETTLFCPRYNNSGGQISVLIVQRAANERAANCDGTAFFYDENQAVVGTQALVIGGNNDVNVYSLPGVPGLAGQRGGAQVAHTCGVGGLKAKLVALEPATGFSFDTLCSPRDQ
jgi:hypothetical protein